MSDLIRTYFAGGDWSVNTGSASTSIQHVLHRSIPMEMSPLTLSATGRRPDTHPVRGTDGTHPPRSQGCGFDPLRCPSVVVVCRCLGVFPLLSTPRPFS